MEEMKLKDEKPQKSVKTSYVNRCCLLIDWYADNRFGAVKLYNMIVQKQNYEVNVSLTNKDSKRVISGIS